MSDEEKEDTGFYLGKGRPKKDPNSVMRGPQPEGKVKRGRGRPKKSEGFRKDPNDRRVFAPILPDIAYQVDRDLEDLGHDQKKKYSDWAKIKWKIFADTYYQTGSAVESYKLAGYNPQTEQSAYAGASRLLAHPWVQAYLRRKELAEVEEIDLSTSELPDSEKELLIAKDDEIMIFLTQTMRDPKSPIGKRMEAARELAKLKGMHVEKVELTSLADRERAVMDALGLGDDALGRGEDEGE